MARIVAGLVNGRPFEAWDVPGGYARIMIQGYDPVDAKKSLLRESAQVANAVSDALDARKAEKKARLIGYRVLVDHTFYVDPETRLLGRSKPKPAALDRAQALAGRFSGSEIKAVYRKKAPSR